MSGFKFLRCDVIGFMFKSLGLKKKSNSTYIGMYLGFGYKYPCMSLCAIVPDKSLLKERKP